MVVTTSTWVDIPALVRETVLNIGYDSSEKGFDGASCGVTIAIGKQSPDIAALMTRWKSASVAAVTRSMPKGAGDQGLMFRVRLRRHPELMPLPISLAHRLSERLAQVRKNGALPTFAPTADPGHHRIRR